VLTYRHRLGWIDVDYARVAFYLRYYVWVDEALHGALYDRGFHIREFMEQGYGLPYINTSCRYFQRLTLEDEVEVRIEFTSVDERGFAIKFQIVKVGEEKPAAEGEITRRCIQLDPPKSVAMPPALRSAVEALKDA
jgi:YbgC/YbaW family acyl-CoA thioester hydrolase